jgi:hypothetical protein
MPAVMALAVVYALWLGMDNIVERFLQAETLRPVVWSGTLNLVADFPLLGTGLNTYVHSFRRHKSTLDPALVDHAHNDYLELLGEVGVVGSLILLVGLARFCWRTLKQWRIRDDPEVRGIVLGGLASVLAIGIHSVFDFNLHIPANALLLAMVLGITSVAVHLRRRHGHSIVTHRIRRLSLPSPLRFVLYPTALLATLALAWPIVVSVAADQQAQFAASLEQRVGGVVAIEAPVEEWGRAVALDPDNAEYRYRLGQAYERVMRVRWLVSPSSALSSGIQAMAAYREAILRNPMSPFPYLAWGWTLENVGRLASWAVGQQVVVDGFRVGRNDVSALMTELAQRPDQAAQWSRQLVQTAAYLAPTAGFAHYSAGLYTLGQWEALPAGERMRVAQELRSAIQLEPGYARAILQAFWEQTQDKDLVWVMARGTSEEARWRDLALNAVSGK